MNTKKLHLDNFRKYLLNRVTATQVIIDFIENILITEDDEIKYCFHKVIVHNWPDREKESQLFDTIAEFYSSAFVPVHCSHHGDFKVFYTSSLGLILKIIKLDFIFPYKRNMYNVDILFNDKSSFECFNERVTVEHVVNNVVSNRFIEKLELDLSNFCEDREFLRKKINFYKLGLLSNFKLLMLRMGRATKSLNLSNNNLSTVPVEILNFFIKGDLTAINLSNNNIPSLSELTRVSSKIERLWIEGNPLCEDIDLLSYVKQIVMKFPRITQLDGIKLNQYGITFPFIKNFLETPDKKTEMVVENFLQQYFTHYDSNRKNILQYYDVNASLTININFTDAEESAMPHYANVSRNILILSQMKVNVYYNRQFKSRGAIISLLGQFPPSTHIPMSFTVDVLKHDSKNLILIVDGVYKERSAGMPERHLQFRRTFVFRIVTSYINSKLTVHYFITNEIFTISSATREQIDFCMQNSLRNPASLGLVNPDPPETDAIYKAFSHITQLKRPEAEARLKIHGWNIKEALQQFISDVTSNKLSADTFFDDDDNMSDLSSLVDEID